MLTYRRRKKRKEEEEEEEEEDAHASISCSLPPFEESKTNEGRLRVDGVDRCVEGIVLLEWTLQDRPEFFACPGEPSEYDSRDSRHLRVTENHQQRLKDPADYPRGTPDYRSFKTTIFHLS